MTTAIEYAKLLSSRQNHIHADLTFSIVSLIVFMYVSVFFYGMSVSTLFSIAAASTGVVCAHLRLVSCIKLTLKELLDQEVIFVV